MSTISPPHRPILFAQTEGRTHLQAWRESIPRNFFTTDANFQSILQMYLGEATYQGAQAALSSFGEQVATVIDPAATINDRLENHPRLIDKMAVLSQAVCLLSETGWELSQAQETDKALWLDFFRNRYLRPPYDPFLDPEYTSRLQKITAQL